MVRPSLGYCLVTAVRDGALIGLVHELIAAMVWRSFESPDFWFRGGFNPVYHLPQGSILVGLLASPYGLFLWLFVQWTGRSLHGLAHCVCAILLTMLVAPLFIIHSFRQQSIDNLALEFYGILAFCGAVATLRVWTHRRSVSP